MRELSHSLVTRFFELKQEQQVVSILVLVLPFAPLVAEGYILNILTNMLILILAALGLQILTGYTEYVSLGHGMFFGIGGYLTAFLMIEYGVSYWLGLLGMVIFMLIATPVIGRLSFISKGIYFALLTFALNFFFQHLVSNLEFLGGNVGITGVPVPHPMLTSSTLYYLFTYSFLLVGIAGWLLLARYRIIDTLTMIGEDEELAKNLGINVERYKLSAFTVSGIYTAMAGSVYIHNVQFASPGVLGFEFSLEFLVILILGGLGTFSGVFFGGVVYTIIEYLAELSGGSTLFVTGALILVVMIYLPDGLVSFFNGNT